MALQKDKSFRIRKGSEHRHPAWQKILTAVLMISAICSACLFARSYNLLNTSIQNERMTSITQLGTLISDKVLLLRKGYVDATRQLASTLMYSGAETLEDLKKLFEYDQDLMLITADGSHMMLDGQKMILNNVQLDHDLSDGKDVLSSFDTVYGLGDYWMFSIPVEGISIEGEEIVGLVNMVAARQYADIAAAILFDEMGASYVVNQDGAILMRPPQTKMGGIFSGYNLLNILSKEMVSEESCAALEKALKEGRENQFTATIQDVIWLVQSVPMEDGLSVVITVPISMTAHATYEGMKDTIIFIAILIVFAGLSMEYAPWAAADSNVVRLTLADGTEIRDEEIYPVAAWAGSIDGRYISGTEKEFPELGTCMEVMERAVKNLGTIAPAKDGRLTLNWS